MQYSDVLQFQKAAGSVDESTKAVMMWAAPGQGQLVAQVLGEPDELMQMYKAIFVGVLPLAREKGWLRD